MLGVNVDILTHLFIFHVQGLFWYFQMWPVGVARGINMHRVLLLVLQIYFHKNSYRKVLNRRFTVHNT